VKNQRFDVLHTRKRTPKKDKDNILNRGGVFKLIECIFRGLLVHDYNHMVNIRLVSYMEYVKFSKTVSTSFSCN